MHLFNEDCVCIKHNQEQIMHKLWVLYYFFQKSLFAVNYFLIAAINLTTRGSLHTCLASSPFYFHAFVLRELAPSKAIGGVRDQKEMSSLFWRTHCCGFSAFHGMSKFNSVPKIWPIQFSGFWLLYRKKRRHFWWFFHYFFL